MSVVVDSSIALAWYLPDESNTKADAVLERTAVYGAAVPFLFGIEFANALLIAERRKRISAAFRREAVGKLAAIPLAHDLEGHGNVWSKCTDFAEAFTLTVYDAAYLELARRLAVPLATLDRRLVAAGQGEAVRPFDP